MYPEYFLGYQIQQGGFGVAVMPPEAPRISCFKMVNVPMKYMLDNVIALLRLKINLISCFNTKYSLIWSFKLSCTVTKLFKQYWVVWVIMANTLSCKVWYVMVCYGKAVLRWTCLCIYSVSQSDLYVWRLIFMYHKEVILTLQLTDI